MADITLRELAKTYDNGFQAVRPTTLEIADRELMVLVGPSGCGKTTTLRMIAGLERATAGDIRIGGRLVNDVPAKDRDVAMVFQNYALYPHLTVAENLAFPLRMRRVADGEVAARVREVADMLGLSGQLEKLPKTLSGGQRQRVAVGRAIVRRPRAFLFDEPLSNLDAQLRGEMRYELRRLQQRLQTTAVYVTHDQVEAMTLGDRITVMAMGSVQQVATPREVYAHPANRFVAGFIGTPAMNFLPAALIRDGDAWWAQLGDGGRLRLDMEHHAGLVGATGRDVVLGIRPEDLAVADEGLAARVDVVEHLGDHQYVYLRVGWLDQALVMKAPVGVEPGIGTGIRVACATRRIHVFDGPGELARNLTRCATTSTAGKA